MTGDGSVRGCRRVTCSDLTCFPGVQCEPSPDGPKCGPCPEGMTGNGSVGGCRRLACSDAPCFPGVKCAVTERGVNCGSCPPGYTGSGRRGDCNKIPQRLYCNDKPCFPGVYCVDTNTGVDCGPCPPGMPLISRYVVIEPISSNECNRTMTSGREARTHRHTLLVTRTGANECTMHKIRGFTLTESIITSYTHKTKNGTSIIKYTNIFRSRVGALIHATRHAFVIL